MLHTFVDANGCPKGSVNVEAHFVYPMLRTLETSMHVLREGTMSKHICCVDYLDIRKTTTIVLISYGWANAEHTCADPMLRTFVDISTALREGPK